MQNSQQFEVGDRVYCMAMGQHGIVERIATDCYKPLVIRFEDDSTANRYYTLDGRWSIESKAPCLFFDKPKFEIPQKPFKPTHKPGTILCMHHKDANSYRIVKVIDGIFCGEYELITAHCLASSYPNDIGQRINGMVLNQYKTEVISEPSE